MATILIIETAQHADGELIALFLQALERGGATAVSLPEASAELAPAIADRRALAAPADNSIESPLSPARSVFRLEGEYWTIVHAGTRLHLKDSKGLRYIAYLLKHPGQILRALDVVAGVPHGALLCAFERSPGPVADRQALSDYRRHLRDLRQEIEDAKEHHDLGRVDKLSTEAEWLERALEEACGLNGRLREVPSMSERARQALTKAVRTALRRIERGNATLASHLARHIRTGYSCGYNPDADCSIAWEL